MLSIKEEFSKVTPPFIWMEVNNNDFDKVLDVGRPLAYRLHNGS